MHTGFSMNFVCYSDSAALSSGFGTVTDFHRGPGVRVSFRIVFLFHCIIVIVATDILPGKFYSFMNSPFILTSVRLVHVCGDCIRWGVGIGFVQKGLHGCQNGRNIICWRPSVLEDPIYFIYKDRKQTCRISRQILPSL